MYIKIFRKTIGTVNVYKEDVDYNTKYSLSGCVI